MARNPVMFVVEVGSVLSTGARRSRDPERLRRLDRRLALVHGAVRQLRRGDGRGARQGAGRELRGHARGDDRAPARADGSLEDVPSSALRVGDEVVVSAGEVIPADGEVIEGIASVDESAITGESAPVIRESGGDRSAVTGGTRVLSDQIVVRVTAQPGESFLDRMIALVEGAERQKTPNEIALNILLAGLTIVFLLAVVTLQPFAVYSGAEQERDRAGRAAGVPDPDHDRRRCSRRSASPAWTGSSAATCWRSRAGRSRPRATARRCCSTRPARSRSATARRPSSCRCPGVDERELADAAQLSSLADETPEGRSIVVLAKERYGLRERDLHEGTLVPFTAETRMSGVDLDGRTIRKGAADAVRRWVADGGGARAARARRDRRGDRRLGRDAARGRRATRGARRDPPQGRGQGRHARALRRSSARWASAR